jgi:hypothetical protein
LFCSSWFVWIFVAQNDTKDIHRNLTKQLFENQPKSLVSFI